MDGYYVGGLIESERRKQKITQKQLALGIFTPQMLCKLEIDQCESDKLQMDVLLQRLGRSPDKLEVFISDEEYRRIRARDVIEELILKGKNSKVKYLLERYKEYYGDNNNVHMMYYNRTNAYLILRTDGDVNEALKYIIAALDWTLPGWNENTFDEYLISSYEMENLLVYGKILYLLGDMDVARMHTEKCLEYIKNKYKNADTEEYAKIIPKCAWLISKVYPEKEHDERVINICEEALDYLRREAIGCFAVPVMEEIISRYKSMKNDERALYWQAFYSTFKCLYDEYAPDVCLDSLFSNVCQREYHLDYETVKGERLSKKYSQEKMADGVFRAAKSLSLIENRKKNISKKHFEQLMGNVGMEKSKYNGLVATNSFDVLQKKNVLEYFVSIRDYEGAYNVFNEMQELLDIRVDDNRRFIEANRIIIDKARGEISAEEALERCKVLLAETYNIDADYNRPPMRNEAIIINQIGICLGELDKVEDEADLLGIITKCYEKSKMDMKYHVRSYHLLNMNYIISVYESGNKQAAVELAKKEIALHMRYAKTRLLSYCCEIIAYSSADNKELEKECKKYLKLAYNLHEFNYESEPREVIAYYYKAWYNEDIAHAYT